MKQKSIILLLLFSLLLSCIPAYAEADSTAYFYVSPNGNDGNDGSKASPLATLEGAVKAVRESGFLKNRKIEVIFEEGVYQTHEGVKLERADSGNRKFPVIYRGAQGAEAIIEGGAVLNASDAAPVTDEAVLRRLNPEAADRIRVIDLKKYGYKTLPDELRSDPYITHPYSPLRFYINEKEQTLARWPNEGEWVRTGKVIDPGVSHLAGTRSFDGRGGAWTYLDERIEGWATYEDVWMYGRYCYDWAPNSTTIAGVDKEKNIITATYNCAYDYGLDKPYYYYNVLEELDCEGEYYTDRKNCMLYYYSPEQEDAELYISYAGTDALTFDGTEYVSFENLIFQGYRGGCVKAKECDSLRFYDCTMRFFGTRAVDITSGYRYIVDNCLMYELGRGGVYITSGDRLYLKPSGSRIINNHIYNFSQWQKTYSAAAYATGVQEVIANNQIHGGDHMALGIGTATVVEYNDVYDVLRTNDDAGMLYAHATAWAIDTHIRRNVFRSSAPRGVVVNTGNWGVYLDGWSSNHNVYENLFYDLQGAIHINGGQFNKAHDNLIVNCETGLYVHGFSSTPCIAFWEKCDAINWNKGIWKYKYPQLVEHRDNSQYNMFKGNSAGNNIFYNVYRNVTEATWVPAYPNSYANNATLQKNIFTDMDSFDFTMGENCPVEDFKELDLSKVGVNKRSYEEIEAELPEF